MEQRPPNDTAREAEELRAENARLRRELLHLRQFIDALQNLAEAAEGKPNDAEVLELLGVVLDNALRSINAEDGSLLVLDEDTGELVFVLTRGELPPEQLAWRRLPPGEGVAGWVARHGRATVVNDAHSDDRFYAGVDTEFHFRTKSIMAAPLIGAGRVLGVVEVLNKQEGMLFSTSDMTLLALICRFAGELLNSLIGGSEAAKQPMRPPA